MNVKRMKMICAILAALVVLLGAAAAFLGVSNAKLKNDYKRYKNIISQDEVEQTLFGQPISTERDGEYRIGIKTADEG